jgi:hypothetical protein
MRPVAVKISMNGAEDRALLGRNPSAASVAATDRGMLRHPFSITRG